MNEDQFNKKWESHIEEGFHGLMIENEEVIEYLDKEFEKELKNNPDFTFSQIKLKFGFARVYVDTDIENIIKWEKKIDEILKIV